MGRGHMAAHPGATRPRRHRPMDPRRPRRGRDTAPRNPRPATTGQHRRDPQVVPRPARPAMSNQPARRVQRRPRPGARRLVVTNYATSGRARERITQHVDPPENPATGGGRTTNGGHAFAPSGVATGGRARCARQTRTPRRRQPSGAVTDFRGVDVSEATRPKDLMWKSRSYLARVDA